MRESRLQSCLSQPARKLSWTLADSLCGPFRISHVCEASVSLQGQRRQTVTSSGVFGMRDIKRASAVKTNQLREESDLVG